MSEKKRIDRKTSHPRWKTVAVDLLAFSLGILVAVALGEIFLRLLWDGFYLKVPPLRHLPDPVMGWVNQPNTSGDYGSPEFFFHRTHNSLGLRGPEVDDSDGKRVLVLGDSFTYGYGVNDDETFCHILSSELEGITLINAGVVGYGTVQELLALRRWLPVLKPDAVLLAVFLNDLADNLRTGRLVEGKPVSNIDYEQIQKDYEKRKKEDAERSFLKNVLRHSYFYRFCSDRIKTLRKKEKTKERIRELTLSPDDRDKAWEITKAALEEIQRILNKSRIPIGIVWIPCELEIDPEALDVKLSPDYEWFRVRLETFADEKGVPFIDPGPELLNYFRTTGTPLFFRYDRHFNRAGHRVFAQAIKAFVESLVPPPSRD